MYKSLAFFDNTNPGYVVQKRLHIECRGYLKPGKRFSVTLVSGWPMDRNPLYYKQSLSRVEVREAVKMLSEKHHMKLERAEEW